MERKSTGINFKRIKWNLVLPVIHIVISWIYELFFLKIGELDPDLGIVLTPAYPSFISFRTEQIFMYIISKLFGCILVFVIWQIIFLLFRKKRILPFVLLLGGFLFLLLDYPYNWLIETDNLMIYSQAIRYHPDYWQSMLTGCLYNACLMVLHHAFFIPVIIASFFLGAVYYLSQKFRIHFGKKAACIPYVVLLFPDAYKIMMNPYRNCIYAVFCIWFFSLLAFDLMEKRVYAIDRFITMGGIALILTVLRTEGIFFAIIFVVLLIWQIKGNVKKMGAYGAAFILLMVFLMVPQKLGEAKYFGNDYMIANYINVLCSIFNDENADYSYSGAKEDLEAVAAVTPLEVIRYNGLVSYYDYNLIERGSANQTLVTKEEQKAFLQAGLRLFSHNLSNVIFNRIRYFAAANGISELEYEFRYPASDAMFDALTTRSTFGLNEVIDANRMPLLANWIVTPVAKKGQSILDRVLYVWYSLLIQTRLFLISRVLALCMLILTVINAAKKGERKEAAVGFVLLLMWGIIIAFSPEAREAYYYPVYYSSLIWAVVFLWKDVAAASKEQSTECKSEE